MLFGTQHPPQCWVCMGVAWGIFLSYIGSIERYITPVMETEVKNHVKNETESLGEFMQGAKGGGCTVPSPKRGRKPI